MKLTLQPKVLEWARKRAGFSTRELAEKIDKKNIDIYINKISQWEQDGIIYKGDADKISQKAYIPFGYLFLSKPYKEKLPTNDFRTVDRDSISNPSPNLLETIYTAQSRQDWYEEYLIDNGFSKLSYLNRYKIDDDTKKIAQDIRLTIKITRNIAKQFDSWESVLREYIRLIEKAGVLVMRNAIVGNNTKRVLSVEEFRGFALCNDYAPLIFINGQDAKSAQMFTIAHELAHIWLGYSGLSNLDKTFPNAKKIEKKCNEVAAEIIIPSNRIKSEWDKNNNIGREITRLKKLFKLSPIVIARRARDCKLIDDYKFYEIYNREIKTFLDFKNKQKVKKGGGDYYRNLALKTSKKLSWAIIESVKEGNTLYRDAYNLLGVSNSTFNNYTEKLYQNQV